MFLTRAAFTQYQDAHVRVCEVVPNQLFGDTVLRAQLHWPHGSRYFVIVDLDDIRIVPALFPQFFQQDYTISVGQAQISQYHVVFLHLGKYFPCAPASGGANALELLAFQQVAYKVRIYGGGSMTIILPTVPPPSLPKQQSAVLVSILPLQRIVYLYPQWLPYGRLHTISPMAILLLSTSTSFSGGVPIRPSLSYPWLPPCAPHSCPLVS